MMKPMLRFAILALFVSGVAAHAQPVTAAPKGNRAALEQQFRERTAKLAQQRLGLTDAQLARLEQTNARFAPQLEGGSASGMGRSALPRGRKDVGLDVCPCLLLHHAQARGDQGDARYGR